MFECICSVIAARPMIPNLWSAAFSAKFRGCFSNGSENSRSYVTSSAYTANAWVPTLSSPLRSRRLCNGCISYSDNLKPQLIYRYYSSWTASTMKREAVNSSERSGNIYQLTWRHNRDPSLQHPTSENVTKATALLQTSQ